MPKKKKAGKNAKNASINVEKRQLVEADLDGQVYGILEKALGNRFFTVKCLDSVIRRCKVRKKRMKVKEGDCVIIALRDFDDNNADIIYKYDSDEVRQLQKSGILPSVDFISTNKDESDEMDDDGFDFEDI
jgi:translation initiation factor 1A